MKLTWAWEDGKHHLCWSTQRGCEQKCLSTPLSRLCKKNCLAKKYAASHLNVDDVFAASQNVFNLKCTKVLFPPNFTQQSSKSTKCEIYRSTPSGKCIPSWRIGPPLGWSIKCESTTFLMRRLSALISTTTRYTCWWWPDRVSWGHHLLSVNRMWRD